MKKYVTLEQALDALDNMRWGAGQQASQIRTLQQSGELSTLRCIQAEQEIDTWAIARAEALQVLAKTEVEIMKAISQPPKTDNGVCPACGGFNVRREYETMWEGEVFYLVQCQECYSVYWIEKPSDDGSGNKNR